MTSEQFREQMARRLTPGFGAYYGRTVESENLFAEALALGLDPKPAVAFHASYALECAFMNAPELLVPHYGTFVENYLNVTNPSAHRHYSKMMMLLLQRGDLPLPDTQCQRVAEVAFDRLIDPSVRVAVKAWTMEILASLADRLPWVGEQLEETIRFLMERDGSPGLCSRGRKVCRRLRGEQNAKRRPGPNEAMRSADDTTGAEH